MGPRHFCRDRDQDRGTNPQDRGKTEAIDPQDRGQDRGSFGKTEARPRQLITILCKIIDVSPCRIHFIANYRVDRHCYTMNSSCNHKLAMVVLFIIL